MCLDASSLLWVQPLGPMETSESHIWKRVGKKGAVGRSLRVLPLGLKCDSSGVESPGGY